ncbi:hypothetical protein E2C01_002566 [Portunus trituberculatus]|uniref:Uncharacterized protein n=1 Tax=Portunus trituberculatus TaxID=210409 RepID=A0A5B7CNL0_PORTR|nr:hypothetical protein [Portunus trituberculatus]
MMTSYLDHGGWRRRRWPRLGGMVRLPLQVRVRLRVSSISCSSQFFSEFRQHFLVWNVINVIYVLFVQNVLFLWNIYASDTFVMPRRSIILWSSPAGPAAPWYEYLRTLLLDLGLLHYAIWVPAARARQQPHSGRVQRSSITYVIHFLRSVNENVFLNLRKEG